MTCKTSIAATISVIDTANPADTTIALKRKPGSARMSVAGSCFRNPFQIVRGRSTRTNHPVKDAELSK